ncbi:MAG TPA: CoA transferase [Dehalococcoidia bacterium]
MNDAIAAGPLADVRILDLAGEAGVFAGRQLADLGADVIRIEPPVGDAVRWRQPFLDDKSGTERSLYHLHFNANKRGITLDLRRPRGVEVLKRLAVKADALIETAAPGDMDAIGAGYEALRVVNTSLVYVSITPFGQSGPLSRYKGSDITGAAASGLMFLNGDPEDPPNQPGTEQAYHMASLTAGSALLIALFGRDKSQGRAGHRIDVSVQEAASMATLQTANQNYYAWYRRIPARTGMRVFGGRHLYQCADGEWISFVVMPYRWRELMRWFADEGIETVVQGDEWLDPAYRAQHPGAANPAIEALCAKHRRDEMFHQGQKRLISIMPVNDVDDIVADQQLNQRGFFREFEHPESVKPLVDAGPVAAMSATPLQIWRRAPLLGEHNAEVYGGLLGMREGEIAVLRSEGVI